MQYLTLFSLSITDILIRPTSELENRTPKGRSSKRNKGTPVEHETRKNLRSSKGKGRLGATTFPTQSPAKDSKRKSNKDGDESDKKRQRTSSRNSPDEEGEDSEKEKDEVKKEGETCDKDAKVKEEKEDDTMTPKDKEEEKYVPPPPLPYVLSCPKAGCNKKYRQHSGLNFHVSHAHKELLNEQGGIKDMSEIKKMEEEAKARLRKKEEEKNGADGGSEASASGPSSKTSTPGPTEANNSASDTSSANSKPNGEDKSGPNNKSAVNNSAVNTVGQVKSGKITPLPGPPADAKPIPVSAIEGVLPGASRLPPPLLAGAPGMPSVPVTGIPTTSNLSMMGAIPLVTTGAQHPKTSASSNNKPMTIRPPFNARPIVPATAPQLFAPLGHKPIQPRPTIMADPTPNLALEELRKKKEPKKKKENSPGTSPPRLNGTSPKANGKAGDIAMQPPAKSPAYSDISDDEGDKNKRPSSGLPTPTSFAPQFPFGAPYGMPPSSASPQLPQVPVSSASPLPAGGKDNKPKPATAPVPGSIEYKNMLESYGFPPYPQPIPPGMDPNLHIALLAKDPNYKASFEADRALREKLFKEQIDRDNREKDRKAAVAQQKEQQAALERKTPEDLRKKEGASGTLSVKSEFRMDSKPKVEPKAENKEEGSKPTMETRGPPPGTNAYGYMHPSALRPPSGFPPGFPYEALNPLLFAGAGGPFGGANPYLAGHPGMRPPFPGNPADLLRSPFLPPTSGPEDLSRNPAGAAAMAAAAAAAAAGASAGGANANKVLEMLQQQASMFQNQHKIHELAQQQERALKSPSGAGGKASPKPPSRSPGPRRDKTPSPATTPMSMASALAAAASGAADRGRSPPPMRHVHTHTHTHFGLPYPMMPPPASVGAPPAAHSPLSAFPSKYFKHLILEPSLLKQCPWSAAWSLRVATPN